MAGLEGIDASRMEIVDALGVARWDYDPVDRVAKPLLRHADFAPVAVNTPDGRAIQKVRFGMPAGPGGRLITNARRDRLLTAAGWKGLVGTPEHRCLTAISFVVERDADKNAYRIQRRDGGLMVVPGLVARRHITFASTGNEYDDLCHVQITDDANAFVATVHDRFVCELTTRDAHEAWMAPAAAPDDLLALLKPAPNERYEMVPIAPDVWTRRNDPKAVEPIGAPVVWGGKRTQGGQRTLF